MTEKRDISVYPASFPNLDEARNLHSLTAELKENFFSEETVMNLLWGEETGDSPYEKPASFLHIRDPVILRSVTALSLMYLKHAIDTATKPHLINFGSEERIAPPDSEIKVQTPEGFEYNQVEDLQRQWFQKPKMVEKIRDYEKTLNLAFNDFNLKFVLSRMFYASKKFIFEDCEEKRLQERIQQSMKPSGLYSEMDYAYYAMAGSFYKQAGKLWNELAKSDFGRFFILDKDEINAGLSEDFGERDRILAEQQKNQDKIYK